MPNIPGDNYDTPINEIPTINELRIYQNQNMSISMSFPLTSLIRKLLGPIG